MVKVFPFFISLLLLGCGLAFNGDEGCEETYSLKTTVHKPLGFDFVWIDGSLASAYAYLQSEESVQHCSYCSSKCCWCKITSGHYALESNAAGVDSLHVGTSVGFGYKIDSTFVDLLHSIDSTQHLKFSLKDSIGVIKSYDLDFAPILPHINNPKPCEIRGDSIDIFLPEGNFYVVYSGSCYNGVDNFNDFSKECRKYKTSKDPQTITLEIAALGRLSYVIRYDFDEEDKMEEDSFIFKWIYYDAL